MLIGSKQKGVFLPTFSGAIFSFSTMGGAKLSRESV
jgi:hypothetical protein